MGMILMMLLIGGVFFIDWFMFDDFIIKIYFLECLYILNLYVGILKFMVKLFINWEIFYV